MFLSLDLFLFYVFFEVMLLPMYFLIGDLGGRQPRVRGDQVPALHALRLGVHPRRGLDPLLLAGRRGGARLHGPLLRHRPADQIATRRATTAGRSSGGSSCCSSSGSCVKLPSFPFHTWLPDAHVEAPTPISMILAGILLKIGGYGLVRLAWPLAPAGAYDWSYLVAVLGVFSILYGALVAMAQTDFKKLVAYSSVSHMGYVTLGMAVMTSGREAQADPRYYAYGVNGAMFMMIAHGITSAGMFFLVGVIYERAAHAGPEQAGRPAQRHAALRCDLVRDLLRLDGPAGPLRLHRRGVRGPRGIQLQPDPGGARRGGRDPDGRLHSLDPPARSSWGEVRLGKLFPT